MIIDRKMIRKRINEKKLEKKEITNIKEAIEFMKPFQLFKSDEKILTAEQLEIWLIELDNRRNQKNIKNETEFIFKCDECGNLMNSDDVFIKNGLLCNKCKSTKIEALEVEKSRYNTNKKTQLGIEPKWIWEEKRLEDLKKTIEIYYKNGLVIPLEWIEEYNNLLIKRR